MKLKKNLNPIVKLFLAFILAVPVNSVSGQDNMWNNKKCAVSLTYDDGLNVHLDKVVPLLDSLGFRGTFYVPAYFPGFRERLNDWRNTAEKGNELGNHTVFHPCQGDAPGREWVNRNYNLNNYTLERMTDEIRMGNIVLEALDGKKKRTFAYPCGDKKAGDSSYVAEIKNDFTAARSVQQRLEYIDKADLFDVGSFFINGESGTGLIKFAETARDSGALIVFLFHGVGGEHSLNVSAEAHRELLLFLKQNENDFWVAPLNEIAEYVKQYRAED